MTERTLAQAMGAMTGIVPKDNYNEFSRYEYASKDDLYEHVRHALAEQGMVPECTVDRIDDGLVWFKLRFPGDKWELFPLPRPDGKDRNTPQKWGALRGYAVKYWLVNKLLISTGELGVDSDGPPDTPKPKAKPTMAPKERKRKGETAKEQLERLAREKGTASLDWTDPATIEQLLLRIEAHATAQGLDPAKLDKRLVDKYGSVDPAKWTDEQRLFVWRTTIDPKELA